MATSPSSIPPSSPIGGPTSPSSSPSPTAPVAPVDPAHTVVMEKILSEMQKLSKNMTIFNSRSKAFFQRHAQSLGQTFNPINLENKAQRTAYVAGGAARAAVSIGKRIDGVGTVIRGAEQGAQFGRFAGPGGMFAGAAIGALVSAFRLDTMMTAENNRLLSKQMKLNNQWKGAGISSKDLIQAIQLGRRTGLDKDEVISSMVGTAMQKAGAVWGRGGMAEALGAHGINIYNKNGQTKSPHQLNIEVSRQLKSYLRQGRRDEAEMLLQDYGKDPGQMRFFLRYEQDAANGKIKDKNLAEEIRDSARRDVISQYVNTKREEKESEFNNRFAKIERSNAPIWWKEFQKGRIAAERSSFFTDKREWQWKKEAELSPSVQAAIRRAEEEDQALMGIGVEDSDSYGKNGINVHNKKGRIKSKRQLSGEIQGKINSYNRTGDKDKSLLLQDLQNKLSASTFDESSYSAIGSKIGSEIASKLDSSSGRIGKTIGTSSAQAMASSGSISSIGQTIGDKIKSALSGFAGFLGNGQSGTTQSNVGTTNGTTGTSPKHDYSLKNLAGFGKTSWAGWGSTIGSLGGAGIGALFGGVGAVPGAAIGGVVGGAAGAALESLQKGTSFTDNIMSPDAIGGMVLGLFGGLGALGKGVRLVGAPLKAAQSLSKVNRAKSAAKNIRLAKILSKAKGEKLLNHFHKLAKNSSKAKKVALRRTLDRLGGNLIGRWVGGQLSSEEEQMIENTLIQAGVGVEEETQDTANKTGKSYPYRYIAPRRRRLGRSGARRSTLGDVDTSGLYGTNLDYSSFRGQKGDMSGLYGTSGVARRRKGGEKVYGFYVPIDEEKRKEELKREKNDRYYGRDFSMSDVQEGYVLGKVQKNENQPIYHLEDGERVVDLIRTGDINLAGRTLWFGKNAKKGTFRISSIDRALSGVDAAIDLATKQNGSEKGNEVSDDDIFKYGKHTNEFKKFELAARQLAGGKPVSDEDLELFSNIKEVDQYLHAKSTTETKEEIESKRQKALEAVAAQQTGSTPDEEIDFNKYSDIPEVKAFLDLEASGAAGTVREPSLKEKLAALNAGEDTPVDAVSAAREKAYRAILDKRKSIPAGEPLQLTDDDLKSYSNLGEVKEYFDSLQSVNTPAAIEKARQDAYSAANKELESLTPEKMESLRSSAIAAIAKKKNEQRTGENIKLHSLKEGDKGYDVYKRNLEINRMKSFVGDYNVAKRLFAQKGFGELSEEDFNKTSEELRQEAVDAMGGVSTDEATRLSVLEQEKKKRKEENKKMHSLKKGEAGYDVYQRNKALMQVLKVKNGKGTTLEKANAWLSKKGLSTLSEEEFKNLDNNKLRQEVVTAMGGKKEGLLTKAEEVEKAAQEAATSGNEHQASKEAAKEAATAAATSGDTSEPKGMQIVVNVSGTNFQAAEGDQVAASDELLHKMGQYVAKAIVEATPRTGIYG